MAVALLLASVAAPALAHGPYHEIVASLSEQIEASPRNAELHLRRGEAHRAHGDTRAALADYEAAARLDPMIDTLDLLVGEALFDAGRNLAARSRLDRFIAAHPGHGRALLVRARVHAVLRDRAAAVRDFDAAVPALRNATPDEHLERARAHAAAGKPEEARRAVDDAIARFGPVVTLQLYGIELDVADQRWDAALARLGTVMAPAARKDSWLFRRGQILEQAGRREEARAAFQSALASLGALPPHLKQTKATVELEANVRRALAALDVHQRPAGKTTKPRRSRGG